MIAKLLLIYVVAELVLFYILDKLMTVPGPRVSEGHVDYRESPAAYETKSISDMLSLLQPEWIVLKNFYRHGIDADFVVIGPTGIHVIKVKDVRGEIDNFDNLLLLNNKRSINDFIEAVKKPAKDLQPDFRSFGTVNSVIKPILCFTRAHLSSMSRGWYDGVLVTSTRNVIADITGGNRVLTAFDVYGIYTFLCKNSVFRKLSAHNVFRGCCPTAETEAVCSGNTLLN